MTRPVHASLLWLALSIAVASCAKRKDEPRPDTPPQDGDASRGDPPTPPPPAPPAQPGPPLPGPPDEPHDDDDDDHATPTSFSVADLLRTARKATTRFERLAITGAVFDRVKTWKSDTYAWVRLTYTSPDGSGASPEQHLLLACHFHGDELGCHKKNEPDASEPVDTPPDDDDDLPPIEETP